MTPCASACARPTPQPPLTQIRKRYAAQWNDLALVVEGESDSWTTRIQTVAERKVLYQAHRGNLNTAKAAAIEFVMFHAGGDALLAGPEKLSLTLVWK
jgi:hypothetical protein